MTSYRFGANLIVAASLLGLAPQAAAGATLSGCTLSIDDKSYELKGKYQVVESFPDFKVQVVSSFAQLHVEKVTSFPDQCGKWQEVSSFPDFKIQFVESFPDLKIKWVESFPVHSRRAR